MSRQQLIERERRWALPAAVAAFASLGLAIISIPVQSDASSSGNGLADFLRSVDTHAGSVVLASVLSGIGLILLIGPLLYLFRAAQARSPMVRSAFVGFVFIGPALFGLQYIASGIATTQLADDFVSRQGELTANAPSLAEFSKDLKQQPQSFDQVTFYPDENALDATLRDGTIYSLDYPQDREKALQDDVRVADVTSDTDSDGGPGDDLADELRTDSSAQQFATYLLLAALLGLITAVVYTCLHCMRVGLLTRFMGTLGMALGVSIVIIGTVLPLLLYVAALGLLFLGRLPGGRPPAWAAGEAVPWQKSGEPAPAAANPAAIEGEATEVTDATSDNAARRERAKKRKRKRRR